ncbi:unnamed protein product [Knipowitschia caucasica]
MDRSRYPGLAQDRVLVLGVLQTASAGLCAVCGVMDAVFRKDTPLSSTRTPLWAAMVMAGPGVLALFVSQRKHRLLVRAVVLCAALSSLASVLVLGYSGLTLTFGEEDPHVFIHHHSPKVRFVLQRMVRGANATLVLCSLLSLLLSCTLGLGLGLGSCRPGLGLGLGSCRSLPLCTCCDTTTGQERLVPQTDPEDTEMVCSWRATDEGLFQSPASYSEQRERTSTPPPYARLA